MDDSVFRGSDPCFLVAGGPSLIGFDFSKLDGKQVLAINRSFQKLPNADAVYFSDRRFWRWYKDELLTHSGKLYSAKWPNATFLDDDEGRIETYFEFVGREGFEVEYPRIRHGNNSGYAAINVAYHLGARLVVLLGYDMQRGKTGASHWHDGYPVESKDRSWNKMHPFFPAIDLPARAAGMTIINATDGGRLECFPRQPIENFL